MRNRLLFLLFIGLALAVSGCGGDSKQAETQPTPPPAKEESLASVFQKFKSVPGWSYEMTSTLNGKKMMEGSVWFANGKVRMEIQAEGHKMITIHDGESSYLYDPSANTAMKLKANQPAGKAPEKPDKFEQIPVAEWKQLEVTTYDGVICRVLEYTDTTSGDRMKLWLRTDYGAPLRMELTPKQGGATMIQEYRNMKFDPIPPDKFQLPPGVEVMSL